MAIRIKSLECIDELFEGEFELDSRESPYYQLYGNFEFARDFSPWKKGDKITCISFDLESGKITEWSEDSDGPIKEGHFLLQIV